jgi:hypothetical protein
MYRGVAIASQFGGYDRALATTLARTCHGCGWVAGAPFVQSPYSDEPLCLRCSVGRGLDLALATGREQQTQQI